MQAINNARSTIKEIWSYQHPVMHTWFLFSAASLGCMFTLLFFLFEEDLYIFGLDKYTKIYPR